MEQPPRRVVEAHDDLPATTARCPLELTQKRLNEQVRVSYVKVAEYQTRGLVHVHPLIRLDRRMPAYRDDEVHAPPRRFSAELLEEALRGAVTAVSVQAPAEVGGGYMRWGEQLDIQRFSADDDERGRRASYLAKYSTKSTEQAGGLLHRIESSEVERVQVREHVRCFLREAFDVACGEEMRERRVGENAHAFGYRGHCLTKSRRWSTTFKALRDARQRHVHEELLARSSDPAQRELASHATAARLSAFEFVGLGHLTTADAYLAAQAAAQAREKRELGREALYDHHNRRRTDECDLRQDQMRAA